MNAQGHKGHQGHKGKRVRASVALPLCPCVSFVSFVLGATSSAGAGRSRRACCSEYVAHRHLEPAGRHAKAADFLAAHPRARRHPGHALRIGAGQGDHLRAAEGDGVAAGRQGDPAAAPHGRRAGRPHRSGRPTRSTPTIQGNELWGRGAMDMKGQGVAQLLAFLPAELIRWAMPCPFMSIAPRPHSSLPWMVAQTGRSSTALVRRHDVHVMEQDDRLAGRRRHRRLQPREDDRLARRRLVPRERDPFTLEDRRRGSPPLWWYRRADSTCRCAHTPAAAAWLRPALVPPPRATSKDTRRRAKCTHIPCGLNCRVSSSYALQIPRSLGSFCTRSHRSSGRSSRGRRPAGATCTNDSALPRLNRPSELPNA